jgi:hypothetical protein
MPRTTLYDENFLSVNREGTHFLAVVLRYNPGDRGLRVLLDTDTPDELRQMADELRGAASAIDTLYDDLQVQADERQREAASSEVEGRLALSGAGR